MRSIYSGAGLAACLALFSSPVDAQSTLVFDSVSRTFSEAEANAVSMGGHLVSINSAEENEAVRSLKAANGADNVWIGFNDIASEGSFVWTDGSPVTYTNWNSGEPNNIGDEDCTHMFGPNGLWNDIRCVTSYPSVIEIPEAPADLTGSLSYGSCSSTLPEGRFACRVDASGTNNLDTGVRYTVFLRVQQTGRIAFRGEIKPQAGEMVEKSIKFTTNGSDPSSFTLELVAEAGSVSAPSGDAVVLSTLAFTKGGDFLRAEESLSVFPNPATDAATLRFSVTEATEATLVIYDALGREVARPVEGSVEGSVEASFSTSGLPSGVYVARLVVGARAETVRLTVVR